MATTKDILLATATAVSTVGFAVSMALHFTPWPHHKETPQNVVNLSYNTDGETNPTNTLPPTIEFSGEEWPTHIHIKGEPENVQYPIRYTTGTYNDINTRWITYTNTKGDNTLVRLIKQ